MSSVREIAKRANLSTATVSRYINKKGNVSEKTAKRIEEVLKEIDYVPNKLVNAIIKNKTNVIGVLVQDFDNPFFPELISIIEYVCRKRNYSIILSNADFSKRKEGEIIYNFQANRVDGIIVMNTNDSSIYDKIKIPVIGFEERINNRSFVTSENYEGSRLLASEMISSNNITNILYFESAHKSTPNIERKRAINDVLGSKYDVEYIKVNNFTEIEKELSEKKLTNYSHIMCWNDSLAIQVINHLKDEQIQVYGFDNIKMNKFLPYTYPTVEQNITELGHALINTLLAEIENKSEIKDIKVPIKIKNNTDVI
ncbi:MAG: LacI family DNA-binding transcriptional regulator [Mycoplasmatales bacterium]